MGQAVYLTFVTARKAEAAPGQAWTARHHARLASAPALLHKTSSKGKIMSAQASGTSHEISDELLDSITAGGFDPNAFLEMNRQAREAMGDGYVAETGFMVNRAS
jgi:hypothetical protein